MLSLIIPCFNEESVLPLLFKRVTEAARSWNMPYEIIAIDDGSRDGTWQMLKDIAAVDKRWKVLRFSRNFGQETAVSAGLYYSRGECVAIIDADLQDPPELILALLDKWKSGCEVVYAIRTKRKECVLKRICYKAFYLLLSIMAEIDIPMDSGDFCLMDRKIVDLLNAMPEQNRFVRGLRGWVGFRQIGIVYEREARAAGSSQYTIKKLLRLALDGIFSFSTMPIRMATYFGLAVSIFSFMAAAFTFLQRIFMDFSTRLGIGPVPGFATTIISIFFIGGVQLVFLGIIGEYIGRIYSEVKRRPHWILSDSCGLDVKIS